MNNGDHDSCMDGKTPPRFIADAMLGKLARWLRIFGFDVEYSKRSSDEDLLKRTLSEGRILLTRDRDLHRKAFPHSLLLASMELEEQLGEVIEAFGLSSYDPPTRCPICNTILKEVKREDLTSQVPKSSLERYDDFYICPGCGKVYWHGSHWERIVSRARRAGFPNLDPDSADNEE